MSRPRFAPWRDPARQLVAESLELPAGLPLPASRLPMASPAAVSAALARLAAPALATGAPPPYLRAAQVLPWRRLVGAVSEFGGALLAEPVGTGKTWIALGAAAALTHRPVACLVPARLESQWRDVAVRTGVPLVIGTHERASRGRLPEAADLVIVDESHHLRNQSIHRYAHVARWLTGRRAILLSGTPVINRLDDVLHQLALVLHDDALALHGIPSVAALRDADALPDATARVVIRSPAGAALPTRHLVRVQHRASRALAGIMRRLDALAISDDPGIRALVRLAFTRAAASSPAALAASLRRYALLLANHADAKAAGCTMSRDALRRWTGADGEQTVFWPLTGGDSATATLTLADLDPVTELARAVSALRPESDPKARALDSLVADQRRTLVFTVARETVGWLRRALGYHRTAWCAGGDAGIGMTRRPREEVLRLFGPAGTGEPAPALLISTDVAAEGLDLQRAERVVHYDLPWTPARMEQRDGRAVRLDASTPDVEVVRFDPPRALERRLRTEVILRSKSLLPARAQLQNDALAGWPADLARIAIQAPPCAGLASVHHERMRGVLAGVRITGVDEHGRAVSGGQLLWRDERGDHGELPAIREALLLAATAPPSAMTQAQLFRTAEPLDERLGRLMAGLNATLWAPGRHAGHAALVERLRHLRRRAVMDRDGAVLGLVSNAMRFIARGHTAGETLLLRSLGELGGRALLRALAALPDTRPLQHYEARLEALIVFAP